MDFGHRWFLDEMGFEKRGDCYVFDESESLTPPGKEPVTVAIMLNEIKELTTAYGWKLEIM